MDFSGFVEQVCGSLVAWLLQKEDFVVPPEALREFVGCPEEIPYRTCGPLHREPNGECTADRHAPDSSGRAIDLGMRR